MIKPNELRIGNFVLKDGRCRKVEAISIPYYHLLSLRNKVLLEECQFNEVQPIPLTEEILLKCGFDKFLKGIKCSDIYDTYRLGFFQIENHFGIYIFHGVEIKHLHQLQNLFYSIVGEELNIEL